jgi:hypothetical protein
LTGQNPSTIATLSAAGGCPCSLTPT